MIEDARKSFPADVAAANVLMQIAAGAESGFGVVAMNHTNVFKPEGGIGFVESAVEAFRGADIESSGEKMCRVETDAGSGGDTPSVARGEQVAEVAELGSEAGSLPRGVLKEDADG